MIRIQPHPLRQPLPPPPTLKLPLLPDLYELPEWREYEEPEDLYEDPEDLYEELDDLYEEPDDLCDPPECEWLLE